MPTYPLKVSQTLRLHRVCIVRVTAKTVALAIEAQSQADSPAYDDTCWVEYPDLQDETINLATPEDIQAQAKGDPHCNVRVPRDGDLVTLTTMLDTVDDKQSTVTMQPGTLCQVIDRELFANRQGLQFHLQALDAKSKPQFAPFFVDETDLDNGRYPFRLAN